MSGERGSAATAALPVVTTTDRVAFHAAGGAGAVCCASAPSPQALPSSSASTRASIVVRVIASRIRPRSCIREKYRAKDDPTEGCGIMRS